MARIQVLPLPAERLGSVERTPYILVIDEIGVSDVGEMDLGDFWIGDPKAEAIVRVPGTLDVA